MNQGRIEQMGPPEELYSRPRSVFVANFLGRSNLLAGTVTATDRANLVVDVGTAKLALPADRAVRAAGDVLVGVRPEKIHLVGAGAAPPAGHNVVGPGRVVDVSFMGVSTQYQVAVPGHSLPLDVFAQNLGAGDPVRVGDEVTLAWSVDHTFGLDGAEPADAGAVGWEGAP